MVFHFRFSNKGRLIGLIDTVEKQNNDSRKNRTVFVGRTAVRCKTKQTFNSLFRRCERYSCS